MNSAEVHQLVFRKSSFSADEGHDACVAVADLPDGGRAVRDTKDPHGAVLWFTAGEWGAFTAGVRAGEFD